MNFFYHSKRDGSNRFDPSCRVSMNGKQVLHTGENAPFCGRG